MVTIQIITAIAAAVALVSTLIELHAMTCNTDNRIRFSCLLICIASFYMLLTISAAYYMPTLAEFMMFTGYATLSVTSRRERKRLFSRRRRHETICH